MNDREQLALKFKELGFKIGVEVGVSLGKYSEVLLMSNPNLKLYSIDNWEGKYFGNEKEARERLSKYPNSVVIKGDSVEVSKQFADESLDFVYIDGDHTEWGVERDLKTWIPKVRKGGIVSGHDWQLPDVRNTVERFVKDIVVINPNQKYPSWYFIK